MPESQHATNPFRYTVPPGVVTPVTFQTNPDALCQIRPSAGPDNSPVLWVRADPQGIVRVHAAPARGSGGALEWTVDARQWRHHAPSTSFAFRPRAYGGH